MVLGKYTDIQLLIRCIILCKQNLRTGDIRKNRIESVVWETSLFQYACKFCF